MKMVPNPCINIVLWVWLDEWLSVAWGHVKWYFARADTGKRHRELLWGQIVLDMWNIPNIILNLTFSPTENAQYFTVYKPDARRCEKPILTCHYILHPQPPQPKSCTSFYADYISFFRREYIYIYIYIYHHKKDVFPWRLPKKLVSN